MSADTGSSFGARGNESSFRPASCGKRSAFCWFTSLADQTRFSQASLPPRERGTTWSRLPSSGRSTRPVYWQRLPSRSRMLRAFSFGRFLGTRAKFTATMTVGTRSAECIGLSFVVELDFEGGRHVRRHLAEGVGGRANVDRLPVAVEHEHD